MSLSNRISWVIERNLHGELTLDTLAAACGVSRFHLAHAFAQASGQSVMRYLCDRRLSEAAKRLATERPDSILDLALDAGYGSHEAFSRAFRERVGVSPEAVRKSGSTEGLALVEPWSAQASPAAIPDQPLVQRRGAMLFVALVEQYSFEDVTGIPGQWERFMGWYPEIANRVDAAPWAVSRAIDDDERFDYACAAEVSGRGTCPAGLQTIRIEPWSWLVFRHQGHVSQLRNTYAAIWNDWLPAHGHRLTEAASLERHCEAFDPRTGLGGIEIWMASIAEHAV